MTAETDQFVGDVLAWGVPRLRDLPWRRTRDPWAILVSEVMLQQTQVARVVDRWHRYLERFPTAAACAAAPLGDVLREWHGLGYPRRARNLHAAAAEITRLGEFPSDLGGLLSLPGVGPYTARAVMAFAFERDVAVVDTNIARIYARRVGRRLSAREVQEAADEAAPLGDGWTWNQCLMDLGAVVCRPRPLCDECPVDGSCAWRGCSAVADPAIGSAGVSGRQPTFEGSDQQARGRLMKALVDGPVAITDVAPIMCRDAPLAHTLLSSLIDDGLCQATDGQVTLP